MIPNGNTRLLRTVTTPIVGETVKRASSPLPNNHVVVLNQVCALVSFTRWQVGQELLLGEDTMPPSLLSPLRQSIGGVWHGHSPEQTRRFPIMRSYNAANAKIY